MTRCGFTYEHAQAAIQEATHDDIPAEVLAMPTIDTASNTIHVLGRDISVLMSLSQPHIVLLGNVLTDDECEALVQYCEPKFAPSTVVNDEEGTATVHPNRTSKCAMMQRAEVPVVELLEERLAALCAWPTECGEGLQLQRYGPADQYKPHYDWFEPNAPGSASIMDQGGQRLATFILYLTDVEAGGSTAFTNIGLEIFPRKGNALFFLDTDAYHRPDKATLHAGSPVIRGTKIVANKWLRERTY